jgi:hypothetical protein
MLNKEEPMEVRLGKELDVCQILDIQKYWLNQKPDNKEGFLFGEPYTYNDLIELVLLKQLAVATVENIVYGYFLFDDYSKNSTTSSYLVFIQDLINKRQLNKFEKICPRAQIAIHKSHLGLNISKKLTLFLIDQCKDRFDTIFSAVSKKNKKINEHITNGWIVVGENDDLYFVTMRLNTKRNTN